MALRGATSEAPAVEAGETRGDSGYAGTLEVLTMASILVVSIW